MVALRILVAALCCFFMASHTGAMQNRVHPPNYQDVYEFWLSVDYRLTMAEWKNDHAPPVYFNLTDHDYYYRSNVPFDGCTSYHKFQGDLSKVIIGDGRHRDVIAVNDSIPAPTLVVYSGSTVIVHVTNHMDEPISVHWHGFDQRGTFFMDGVSSLTQCPIGRGHTFTYKFKVSDPPGTYWYHGHTARDRCDGLFGALIVLDDKEESKYQDMIAVINDWYSKGSDFYYQHTRNNNEMFTNGYEDCTNCFRVDRDTVGSRLGVLPWESAIVNGRGWYNTTELRAHADRLPLEEFHAKSDPTRPIRFRLINSGMVYGLMFSVDQHQMTIIAADSYDVKEVKRVDYVHLTPGERFDVVLTPMKNTRVANRAFPIRIRSMQRLDLDMNEQEDLANDHFGMAWLIYDHGKKGQYEDESRRCTNGDPCVVANCPFAQYPNRYNRTCLNIDQMSSTQLDDIENSHDEVLRPSPDKFEQYFLNFDFQEHVHTVNGRQFIPPKFPPFMHPGRESQMMHECAYECGRERKCACTNHVDLTLGNVVELVMYNRGSNKVDATGGVGHPVHLHGHHFHVLKTVWPSYDDTNGLADRCNEDLTCDNFFCNYASWSYVAENRTIQTKEGRYQPWQYVSENGYKPVLKDSVFVPFGGYVVVRFKADNPGWWFSHCHILPHSADGMAIIFREGRPDQMPKPDNDYPVCGMTFGQVLQQ